MYMKQVQELLPRSFEEAQCEKSCLFQNLQLQSLATTIALPKLKLLKIVNEMSTEPKKIQEAPNDTSLQQQLCQNISFKSLPALETKNSLEEIRRLRRQAEHPRKNILRSFVKATTFEKRPRRRLNQNKSSEDKSNQAISNLSQISNPELNIQKLRQKLTKEKDFVIFDIHRLGKKIRNHFKKELREPQVDIQKEEFLEGKSSSKSKCDWNKKEAENIVKSVKKMNIDETESKSFKLPIKPESMEMSEKCSKDSESTIDYSESNNLNSDSSAESEKSLEKLNDTQTLCTQRKLDFSSGDDAKNYATFESNENCESDNLMTEESENLDSKKRSVQWNGEVDVLYYAGDSDGGKILGREREPLREEADQQARHKKFNELMMKKNLLSKISGMQFCDSWKVSFPK